MTHKQTSLRALPTLTPDTAKMFDLINDIGAAHYELTKLYEKVYKDNGTAGEALYKLQDIWLDRVYSIMRDHFWTNHMEL